MKEIHQCPVCASKTFTVTETTPTTYFIEEWKSQNPQMSIILQTAMDNGEIPTSISFATCSSCQVEFSTPMFSAGSEWYQDFEHYHLKWEHYHCLEKLKPNSRILEIGCGEGRFLEIANAKGHTSLGLDFNLKAVKKAQEKGLNVNCWDLRELKSRIGDQEFDAVVFFQVLEHIDDLASFFSDLSLIMGPNTSLHLACPSPNRYSIHLKPWIDQSPREIWDYPPHHQTRWNETSLKTLLEQFNWKMTACEYEPVDIRNLGTHLAFEEARRQGKSLEEANPIVRKISIASHMLSFAWKARSFSGVGMYCTALHQPS
jgi:cyclopropane fatty-acyl-phospholipid synthase-like methyltransferase